MIGGWERAVRRAVEVADAVLHPVAVHAQPSATAVPADDPFDQLERLLAALLPRQAQPPPPEAVSRRAGHVAADEPTAWRLPPAPAADAAPVGARSPRPGQPSGPPSAPDGTAGDRGDEVPSAGGARPSGPPFPAAPPAGASAAAERGVTGRTGPPRRGPRRPRPAATPAGPSEQEAIGSETLLHGRGPAQGPAQPGAPESRADATFLPTGWPPGWVGGPATGPAAPVGPSTQPVGPRSQPVGPASAAPDGQDVGPGPEANRRPRPPGVRLAAGPSQVAALLASHITAPPDGVGSHADVPRARDALQASPPPAGPARGGEPSPAASPGAQDAALPGDRGDGAPGRLDADEDALADRVLEKLQDRLRDESIRRFGLTGGGV